MLQIRSLIFANSTKKSTKTVKTVKNDSTNNEPDIVATKDVMKKVLDDHNIDYSSNVTRDQLIKLINLQHPIQKDQPFVELAEPHLIFGHL